jgi:hypothetical protein
LDYRNLNSNACPGRRLNTVETVAFPLEILAEGIGHMKHQRRALYQDLPQTITHPSVVLEVYYMAFVSYLFCEAISISNQLSNGRMTGK